MADIPATPEEHLQELREQQQEDRALVDEIEARIAERGDTIDHWIDEDKAVRSLIDHNVLRPWLVLSEADRAEAKVGGLDNVDFRALLLAVLERETGIPQRNVFGCDHGPQQGRVPFCGDECTKTRVDILVSKLKDPVERWKYMNGVGWTQLTWYEKVLRCDALEGGASEPRNQIRIGAEDLAVLVKQYGLFSGVRRYNGSGPAAEEYARDVVNNKLPRMRQWLATA